MKLGSLSLACVLGMSTFLFAGCGNNNGVGTKSVDHARVLDGHTAYRTNSLGRTDTGTLRAPGYNNAGYFGTNGTTGYGTNGNYGMTGTSRYGTTGTTAPGTGYYGTTGTTTPGYGMNGYYGTTGYGTNGYGTTGTSRYGTTGTNGFGSSAYGYNGTTGTSSMMNGNGRIHGLSVTRNANSHVLQLGNLTIVGTKNGSHASGMNGMTSSSLNRTTRLGTSGSNGTLSSNATRTGTTARTLTVTDRKAVDAIDRVNRMLSSGSSLHAKSGTLAKDLTYILKKASESSTAGTSTGMSAAGHR